jgi:RNA polymerase sigma-70 factor (ECF subfamily)
MPELLSDAVLLERFVKRREEAAFVILVERHGPLVARTCRRLLRDDHDVEDVLQATFFVLARKASGGAWQGSLGGWLCAVAYRLALHARTDLARRRAREKSMSALARRLSHDGALDEPPAGLPEHDHPLFDPAVELERRDLRRVIDDEIGNLPEKYRAPMVLCELQGRTHQEAARALGWPAGSMSRRLRRARLLLKARLTDRGVSLAVGLIGIALALYAVRNTGTDSSRATPVRREMGDFKSVSDGGQGFEALLAQMSRGERAGEPGRVANLARQVAQVAFRLKECAPAHKRDAWNTRVTEMRQSGLELAMASEGSDQTAILAAARRLSASCVKCHQVFRE